jgi:hypothetical protein
MAVRGTKLKPEGQSRTRHRPTHEWVEVPDVPFADGPALPRRKGGWPAGTKRWWAVVSAMPHCRLWSPADWQFALDTASIAAPFHEGDMRVATELRQREKVLGTTMDARRDLRIRYVEAPGEVDEDSGVTRLDDYRDL